MDEAIEIDIKLQRVSVVAVTDAAKLASKSFGFAIQGNPIALFTIADFGVACQVVFDLTRSENTACLFPYIILTRRCIVPENVHYYTPEQKYHMMKCLGSPHSSCNIQTAIDA
jgi:hypothetical protein